MRSYLAASATLIALAGCGNETGILISVTADDATIATPVEQLHVVVGLATARPNTTVFVADRSAEVIADVTDRDLFQDAFTVLLHDGGPGPDPSTIMVAVIGSAGDTAVGVASLAAPQQFMPCDTLEHDLLLVGGPDPFFTDTGCLTVNGVTIVSPDDMDCDGDPATTDCNDDDPLISSTATEQCNGVDDDCDDMIDEGCGDECEDITDCEAQFGAAPCGAWECNFSQCEVVCPDCTDGDLDGYGTGTGCAGPDCDDDDDTLGESGARACYSGPAGTEGVGTCQAGAEFCSNGVLGPCTGEVTPSGEACNDEDDDCDTMVDEDLGTISCGVGACLATAAACVSGSLGMCTAGGPVGVLDSTCDQIDDDCDGAVDEDCVTCVQVTTPGNGGNDANGAPPFATIQAAIAFAANDSNQPNVICVAPGTACNSAATFSGPVAMADGIHVYGGYESTTWTRCGAPTTIQTGTATGVLFDDSISNTTVLDGFIINRASTSTTAGVTVDSANNVVLSNLEISNTPAVASSYGINLINQADALITRVSVFGGNGTAETIGIRSIDSTPTIRDNCTTITATGHCDAWCGNGAQFGIRGRYPNGSGDVYAVYLQDSRDALVESSAVCGTNGVNGGGVFITGEADGVIVRKNSIDVGAATVANHGVWMEDCDGDAPWIVDNTRIMSNGELPTTEVNAVRAIGDCHPVIDSNELIVGGGEGVSAGTIGVYCGANLTASSECVILGNQLIQGSIFGFPPFAMGVRCDDDGCMRIANNTIDGHGGVNAYGVFLGATGPFIDDNDIIGGCGASSTTGLRAEGAYARIQNNRITSGQCGVDAISTFIGLDVYLDDTNNELDVHSNTIDGRGDAVSCASVGLRLGSSNTTPTTSSGVYRNNIILAGRCNASAYNIAETDASADPRLLEHNNLDPRATPTALYRDEGTTNVATVASVNALSDISAKNNLSVDSEFVSYNTDLHITSQSMCIAAGTPAGAPALDMDGDVRDMSTPDIGADEF